MRRLSAYILATLIFAVSPAAAETAMTFEVTLIGRVGTIFAHGAITRDTPEVFASVVRSNNMVYARVFFDSPGGNLISALELGRLIRGLKFDTHVGTNLVNPSLCASACTFAFLGGIKRSVSPGSRFGVHQFKGVTGNVEQSAQLTAGVLVDYIREMNISTELFTLMSDVPPDQIRYLDSATLRKLQIANGAAITGNFQGKTLAVVLKEGDEETSRIDFFCGDRHQIVARAYAKLEKLDDLKWTYWRQVNAPPEEVRATSYSFAGASSPGNMFDIVLDPGTVDALAKAQHFRLSASMQLSGGRFTIFGLGIVHSADPGPVVPQDVGLMLRGLAESCR